VHRVTTLQSGRRVDLRAAISLIELTTSMRHKILVRLASIFSDKFEKTPS
jgi:hypothetical protein